MALINFEQYRNKRDGKTEQVECVADNDINLTLEEWSEISGVGSITAERLVESQPYRSIEEISEIKGIRSKVIENIENWLAKE